MIRIICREDDAAAAAYGAGSIAISHKSFDVTLPELEKWLLETPNGYVRRSVVGIELLEAAE